MSKILVLGAGYSGLIAALRIDRRAQVTVVDARDRFVQRIRQHQVAAGQPVHQPRIDSILRRNMRFVQGWVRSLDLDRQTATVRTDDGELRLDYDILIYALGSAIATDNAPGVADYAYTLNPTGPRSAPALHAALPEIARRGGTLAVVGGGLTGIEAASELAETYPGLRVQLFARSEVGPGLSAKGRQHIARVFARLGVETHEHVSVTRVEADAVVTSGGQRLPVDATVWLASFTVSPLARQAGLAVDAAGRVQVGPDLRSWSHDNVFAVGDAAAVVERSGVPIRMACATGMPIGAHAGSNVNALLRGQPLTPFSFRYFIQCISLGRHNALIQLVHGDDQPKERIITGRLGVWIKEAICRFTVQSLYWERRWPGLYAWPGQHAKPATARQSETVVQHG